MAQRALPGIGLTGFWDLGYEPWKNENDTNLQLLSALVQCSVLSIEATTPGAPTDGDIYLLSAAHPTNPNELAIRDAGAWFYVVPRPGAFLYDQDSAEYYSFDGTDWVVFSSGSGGGGGTGGSVLIAETITAGSASQVIFSALPTDYRDLKVIIRARGNTASSFTDVRVQFNGDTAANYDNVSAASNAAAGTAFGGSVAATSILAATVPANTAPALTFGYAEFEIGDYKGTTNHKSVGGKATYKLANTTAGMNQQTIGACWRAAAAVNSIRLFLAAGNFADGSIISVYGIEDTVGTGSLLGNESIMIACSDETTSISAGTSKTTFPMPYGFTLTSVKAYLSTAQATGATFTVDINVNGATILSTKITIDNGEKSSLTAAIAPVLSTLVIANDAEVTVDVDVVGDGTAKGLKVILLGHQ